ncbi:MAG: sigma-70 family RNA polymerase sigma factor [Gammaproteobacteria bacterium]|nr:sigma-70 family RNA polymerase sigma factor [Gammaproteobacteria bacterium]
MSSVAAPTQAEFHEAIAKRSDTWYSACLRITRDFDLAEDAVQDALLNAWHKRNQYERSARLDTWIHRIAVNAALQLLRKRRPDAWDALDTDIQDHTETPDTARADQELNTSLTAALQELSEKERVCFVLKHLEQWRLKEIAEELDTSISSTKQALFRAVKKLRVSMASLRSVG